MSFGKVVKAIDKEIEINDRIITVWFKEFESGVQKVGAHFVDRCRKWLTTRNVELTKKVRELEGQLSKKEIPENNFENSEQKETQE